MTQVKFSVLELETSLGARYVFPDVEKDIVDQLLRQWPPRDGKVGLANASGAFLSLPFRIVQKLTVDSTVHWNRENP